MLNGKQYIVIAVSGGSYSGEYLAFSLLPTSEAWSVCILLEECLEPSFSVIVLAVVAHKFAEAPFQPICRSGGLAELS